MGDPESTQERAERLVAWGTSRALELREVGEGGDKNNDAYEAWLQPKRRKAALWAREIWETVLGMRDSVHTRRVHYALLGRSISVPWTPRGYAEGEYCYAEDGGRQVNDYYEVIKAFRDARYLDLISAEVIADERNPGVRYFGERERDPSWYWTPLRRRSDFNLRGKVSLGGWDYVLQSPIPEWETPEERGVLWRLEERWQDLEGDYFRLYDAVLPHRLAIVSEKSGVNDAVDTAMRRLRVPVDYLEMKGNASLTRVIEYVDRIQRDYPGKEIVIGYLSDRDMAGVNMPVEFSRRLMYEIEKRAVIDGENIPVLRLYHLALTQEQVDRFDLPWAPESKDPRKRKYELDALAELHPGALEDLIVDFFRRYHDPKLASLCVQAKEWVRSLWQDAAQDLVDRRKEETKEAYDHFAPELEEAWAKVEEAVGEFEGSLEEKDEEISAYNELHDFELDEDVYEMLRNAYGVDPGVRRIEEPDARLVAVFGSKNGVEDA